MLENFYNLRNYFWKVNGIQVKNFKVMISLIKMLYASKLDVFIETNWSLQVSTDPNQMDQMKFPWQKIVLGLQAFQRLTTKTTTPMHWLCFETLLILLKPNTHKLRTHPDSFEVICRAGSSFIIFEL